MPATWSLTGQSRSTSHPLIFIIQYCSCSSLVSATSVATEPAVFELACVHNSVKHVVICGHSDCKAVNLLYDLHTDPNASKRGETFSPLKEWVALHGRRSINEFFQLEKVRYLSCFLC